MGAGLIFLWNATRGKPAAALAERVPEVAGGDLHGEARGGGRAAGLRAVSVCRTKADAAVSAMADGDEELRTRGGEAVRAGRWTRREFLEEGGAAGRGRGDGDGVATDCSRSRLCG